MLGWLSLGLLLPAGIYVARKVRQARHEHAHAALRRHAHQFGVKRDTEAARQPYDYQKAVSAKQDRERLARLTRRLADRRLRRLP